MQLDDMERRIEAVLFAAGEPIESARIAQALDLEQKTVDRLVERIRERYLEQDSPLDIVLLDGSYQMCTLPRHAADIRAVLTLRKGAPLSQAALEVLAVIAYNQPVTRSFVEQVRGVDCSSIVRSLTEKGLVEEAGRLQIPGKPISYRTTAGFLRCFGLNSLSQLPVLPDLPPVSGGEDEEPQLEGQIDFFEVDE